MITFDKIKGILVEFGKLNGTDIEDLLEPKTKGTIGEFKLHHNIKDAVDMLLKGETNSAYTLTIDTISDILYNTRVRIDVDYLKSHGQLCIWYSNVYGEYIEWKNNISREWDEYISSNPFRSVTDNLENGVQYIDTTKFKELFNESKRLIKHYTYKKGIVPLYEMHNAEWVIPNDFIITNSLHNVLNNLSTPTDDKIHYKIVGIIDDIVTTSYFVIISQYKDNIEIITDNIVYNNLASKQRMAQRNFRFMENNWDNIPLPYNLLIDTIERERANNTQIAYTHNNLELYHVNIQETWDVYYKDYLFLILNEFRSMLGRDTKHANLLGAYINNEQLLLDYNKDIETRTTHFDKINIDRCDGYVNDILLDEPSTSLVKLDNSVILNNNLYNPNVLLSQVDYIRNVEHLAYDSKAKDLQSKLTFSKELMESTIKNIESELTKQRDFLIETIFKYDYFIVVDDKNSENFIYSTMLGGHGLDLRIADETFNPYVGESSCMRCDKYYVSYKRATHFKFTHYAIISYLLKTNRESLPLSIRNYKSKHFFPYVGNRILDNINPLYLVRDSMSNRYKSSISGSLYLCGHCVRKFKKNHVDGLTLLINKNGEYVGEDLIDNLKKNQNKIAQI